MGGGVAAGWKPLLVEGSCSASPEYDRSGKIALLPLPLGSLILIRIGSNHDICQACCRRPAPQFSLPDSDGNSVDLASYRGRKVILYFYPAASTPGCTTQACDFRDNMASLEREGYVVLGISKDSPSALKKFSAEESLSFPLLSDPALVVHQSYGAYGEKSLYGKKVTGVLRSTFVVDEDGFILQALYNVRATGHVESLRKRLLF